MQVQPDLAHLAFEVEDWDASEKHLQKLGVAVSDGSHRFEDGSVIALVDGPESYEIEFIQQPKGK